MAYTELSIQDFDRLQQTLKRLPQATQTEAMDDALWNAAPVIVNKAKEIARERLYKTGNLSRNIRRSPKRKGGRRFTNIIVGNNKTRKEGGVFYGHFLEFGTRKQSPKPFVVPAILDSLNQFVNQTANYVTDVGMRKAVRKAKPKSKSKTKLA